jgi:hypothetical protein
MPWYALRRFVLVLPLLIRITFISFARGASILRGGMTR